jgi:hypothetical protein
MKTTTVILCMALALGSASIQAASVGEVVAVRGETHLGAGGPALSPGQKLEAGSEIHTGADGRVRVRFIDGSTVVVADRSRFKIERFDTSSDKARDASLLLERGLIGQQVSRQEGGKWEVRTPTAVTAVRGTEFFVEVGTDLATAVSLQSGEVEVEAIESAAGGTTRQLRPPSKTSLSRPRDGTDCTPARGCTPAATWSPARIQAVLDRLSF